MTAIFGIVGVGGFAREVMPVAAAMLKARQPEIGSANLVFVDTDLDQREVSGFNVVNESDFLRSKGKRFFAVAIADAALRERITDKYLAVGCQLFSIIAPSSESLSSNTVGDGCILSSNTIITSNAKIGKSFHCNIYSYVAHDCIIGDYVTFAPRVSCNGNIVVEDYAYIGTGAVLRQGTANRPLRIGRGSVVGMGAVVTKDVPPGVTVVGNPARILGRS